MLHRMRRSDKKTARDRTLALAFLKRADRCRFSDLWHDLGN